MQEENQKTSATLIQKIELLLQNYQGLKDEVKRLKSELETKNSAIKNLEEKLLEKELQEEDIISKIESALNNNGL